ncbi:MAG: DUF4325 domain-containing protein [Candidatus Moranbacteria bacterium]|nr:DUF4325 domain-containing protein [Candidatus Moranbacteria bacterium]
MIVELKKFGTTLISRQSGKEAFAVFALNLKVVPKSEKVIVDFTDVITFSPSWGDEFITPLYEKYKDNLILKNTKNPSVEATLKLLEKIGAITMNNEQ